MAIKLFWGGVNGRPSFSEVSVCSQLVEALRRLLSSTVESQLPSVKNNPNAKVAYFDSFH